MRSFRPRLLLAALLLLTLATTAVVVPVAPVVAGPPAASRDRTGSPDWVHLPARCTDDVGYPRPIKCVIRAHAPGAPVLVLWGDSHAWQLVPALRQAVEGHRVGLVSFIYGGCPPMYVALETERQRDRANSCEVFGHEVVEQLRRMLEYRRPVRLVVATSWELYHDVTDEPNAADKRWPGSTTPFVTENAGRALTGLPRAFRMLGRLGVATDVVGQQPMVPSNQTCSHFRCTEPRRAVLKDAVENMANIRAMRDRLASGRLVRPATALCGSSTCPGEANGVPVYLDRLHVGARTSRRLAPLFGPTVQALLDE